MDSRLQNLKRQGATDPLALQAYHREVCRIKGHQWTGKHHIQNQLSRGFDVDGDWITVKVCWRCHATEVDASNQTRMQGKVPDILLYHSPKSNAYPYVYHSIVSIRIWRIKRGLSRVQLKTACNKNFMDHPSRLSIPAGHVLPTCSKCQHVKKLAKARTKAKELYIKLHNIISENANKVDSASNCSSYLPPYESDV